MARGNGEVALEPAADVFGLGYGEHLLVWSLRRLASEGYPCPLVAHEFADACGADASEVFATFRAFLGVLAYAGRRRLSVGHPGFLRLTSDERRLLTLIAVAQLDDATWLDAHLCWLARAELRPQLALAARTLAAALAAHDLRLSLPARPNGTRYSEAPVAVRSATPVTGAAAVVDLRPIRNSARQSATRPNST